MGNKNTIVNMPYTHEYTMGHIQVTFETHSHTQRQTTEIEIVHGHKLTSYTPTDIHTAHTHTSTPRPTKLFTFALIHRILDAVYGFV